MDDTTIHDADDSAQPQPQPQPQPKPRSTLKAAIEFARAGLDSYPVWQHAEGGRKPKAPACGHGYKDATHDPAQLQRLFAGDGLGVAIRTGLVAAGPYKGKYLTIIDVDRAKKDGEIDGAETLEDWKAGRIDGVAHTLPETLSARSGNGGLHLYYLTEKPRGSIANSNLRLDVRCGGGGIVAPPTRIERADGTMGAYEWLGDGFDPDRIAEADEEVEALLDIICEKKAPVTGDEAEARRCEAAGEPSPRYSKPKYVPCGSRHDAALRYAAHLQALAHPDDEIVRRVFDFNERECEEPLEYDEVWDILVWVLAKPKGSELSRRLAPGGEGREPRPDEGDGPETVDAPTDESERVHSYIRGVMDRYKVYETNEKGRVVFHPSRLTDAVIYGLHACSLGGAPAVWDGRQYLFGTEALAYVVEVACPSASDSSNKGAVKKILARLKVERDFDLPPCGLIRFENCVYSCETGEVTPLDKASWQSRIPNPIPHSLDLDAPAVNVVDRFLDDLSDGHEDIRRNLLQIIFLCMARYMHHEQVVVLIGTGANGKSKYVDVVLRVVGVGNCSFLSIDRMRNRFEVGDLAGSLVNLSNEISSEYLSGDTTSIWKQVSGGDIIKADVKNLPGYAFRPYCQLVIVGNAFPRMEGGIDKAVSRRLHIVPFTHSFRDANGRYSDDADPHIVERMTEPHAMAYLIRLALEEGHKMLAEREFRLTPNYASEQEVRKLAQDNSSVLAWADYASLTAEDLHMQRRQTVYERYSGWCRRSALKPVATPRFNEELGTYFPGLELVTARATRHDANECGWLGPGHMVQYRAFSVPEMAESDRANGVRYIEVYGRREVVTSVTSNEKGERRETCRVEEVSLGVFRDSELPKPQASSRVIVPQAWWEAITRFE